MAAAKRQRRPTWIWPFRVPAGVAAYTFWASRRLGEVLQPWPCWLLAGSLVGALPVLLDLAVGLRCSPLLTALLLMPLLAATAAHDAPGRGLGAVAAAYLAHSGVVLRLAAHDPVRLARHFPDGLAYWAESRVWQATGHSPEYDVLLTPISFARCADFLSAA